MRFMSVISFAILPITIGICGQGAAPAETINVWPGQAPGEKGDIGKQTSQTRGGVTRISNVTVPKLAYYPAPKDKRTGTMVVVCPGGAYRILAIDKEGTEIAEWLNSIGVDAAVLTYRVPRRKGRKPWEAALQDAQRAMSIVRSKAKAWGVKPDHIGILGFSAGGHLCATTSTQHAKRTYPAIDDIDKVSCRPDFSVLIYPAYMVGKGLKLNPEITVDKKTPPAFMVHNCFDRNTIDSSIAYCRALKANKIPAEVHIYAKGGHGFGMRPEAGLCATWPARCEDWMKEMDFIPKK